MIGEPLQVSTLVDEIDSQEIVVPEIQRGYVWKKQQAARLIESLYRDFPTGSILLWDPPEVVANGIVTRALKNQGANKRANFRPKIVLDGQQRLTSLYKVFRLDKELKVYFNVQEERFELYRSALKNQPLWLSVSEVISAGVVPSRFLGEIEKKQGKVLDQATRETYEARLIRLINIRQYKYPIEIFRSDDYDEVTELFIRINSGGTRLKRAELALAKLALRWPTSISRVFQDTISGYEDQGFDIDSRFLIRCLVSVVTGQSRFMYLDDKLWNLPQGEIKKRWKQTKSGLDNTLTFLRENLSIDSSNVLSSINALVPLVVFLSTANKLSDSDRRRLEYWFCAASLTGRYSARVETNLDQDLAMLRSKDPIGGLIGNLGLQPRGLEIAASDLEGRSTSSPYFMLSYIMARKNKAKDWFLPLGVSKSGIGDSNSIEIHHIFPRGRLNDIYDDDEINDISNLAFLAQRANRGILMSDPAKYLKTIDKERLKEQYIPLDQNIWTIKRYRDFLKARRAELANAMSKFLVDLRPY